MADLAVDFLAGSLGAAASVVVGQPLDTLKVKMQAFPGVHRSLVGCARHTLAREGLRGLYAGTLPALTAVVAENSLLFMCYGATVRAVARAAGVPPGELGVVGHGLAGGAAAFWPSLVLCPTELVKCRLQAAREAAMAAGGRGEVGGPWGMVRAILARDGVPGLYRGLTATFAREIPGYFFFFLAYEGCREALAPAGGSREEVGTLGTLAAGAVAGVTLWTIIFPVDVVKSRLAVSGATTPLLAMLSSIRRREGAGALYSGLTPTLLRTVPATATLLLVVENSRAAMHWWTGRHRETA